MQDFRKMAATANMGINPEMLGPLTRMAYFKIREGVANLDQFLLIVKRSLGRSGSETNPSAAFQPDELKIIKQAYKEGQEGVQSGVTKYADEVVEITSKTGDDIFDAQKSVVTQNKNTIATASNNAKGAFGEIATDVHLTEKGYQPLHIRKTDITQGWGETGIDAVFKKGDEYFIVESKYTGFAKLKMTDDGLQMSDPWVSVQKLLRMDQQMGQICQPVL